MIFSEGGAQRFASVLYTPLTIPSPRVTVQLLCEHGGVRALILLLEQSVQQTRALRAKLAKTEASYTLNSVDNFLTVCRMMVWLRGCRVN